MSKLSDWYRDGKHIPFGSMIEDPLFKEFIEIVKEAAESNSTMVTEIAASSAAAETTLRLSLVQASQAGMIEVTKLVKKLTRAPEQKERMKAPVPFEHIKDDYIETQNKPVLPRETLTP